MGALGREREVGEVGEVGAREDDLDKGGVPAGIGGTIGPAVETVHTSTRCTILLKSPGDTYKI